MYIYRNSENAKDIFLNVIKIGTKNLRSLGERGIVYVTENRRLNKYFSNISATNWIVLARMCLSMNFFFCEYLTNHPLLHREISSLTFGFFLVKN